MDLLLDTFVPPDTNENENPYQRETRQNNEIPVSANLEPPITIDEFDLALKSAKAKKAPGPDRVPPEVLRNLEQTNRDSLLALLNLCLENEYFPKTWKRAKLKIIRKARQRDWSNPSSYRPICLLPVVGNVYERVLKKRLIEDNNLLSHHQFGFQQGKSTTQAIELLKDSLINSRSTYVVVVLIDIDKEPLMASGGPKLSRT